VFIGASAFLIWGLLPLYLKRLTEVGAFELLSHRIVWSVVCLLSFMLILKRGTALIAAIKDWKSLRILIVTATIIAGNWTVFIYAINTNQALEASMGYFINPLISVFLGFLFLKETMTPRQWTAIACAAIGVTFMVTHLGHFPVIALSLAVSFAFYGLLRKKITVDGATGLLIESLILVPIALGYLIWLEYQGTGSFMHKSTQLDILLLLGGPITALPLALFGIAVQRVRLSTIGLMQYLAPSTQFIIAVMVFQEPFTQTHQWTFAFIWTGLVIYSLPRSFINRLGLDIR